MGVLNLSVFSSGLLLKPKELKHYKMMAMTLLAFTAMSASQSFQPLLGVVRPLEPSSALGLKSCFLSKYMFHILRFHVKLHLKRGPVLKDV